MVEKNGSRRRSGKCEEAGEMDMEATDFRKSVRLILAGAAQDEELCELLTALGVEKTMLNAVHLAICLKAMKGDVSAAKYLREIAEGEEDSGENGFEMPDLTVLSDRELRTMAAKLPEDRREVENE